MNDESQNYEYLNYEDLERLRDQYIKNLSNLMRDQARFGDDHHGSLDLKYRIRTERERIKKINDEIKDRESKNLVPDSIYNERILASPPKNKLSIILIPFFL